MGPSKMGRLTAAYVLCLINQTWHLRSKLSQTFDISVAAALRAFTRRRAHGYS